MSRPHPGAATRWRVALAVGADVAAVLLVWAALVAPNRPDRLVPAAFLRIPLEGLAVAALALVLPRRARRALIAVAGVLLGLVAVLKLLDLGFFSVLDRPFDPLNDGSQLGAAVDYVRSSMGDLVATGAEAGAVVLAVALVVVMVLALGRLARLVARHRAPSARVTAGATVAWAVCAALGLGLVAQEPIASVDAGRLLGDEGRTVAADLRAQQQFAAAVASDRFGNPASVDLAGLRGKDVLLVFVESYGRVAVQGPASRPVQKLLAASTQRLRAAGYSSRSAFLTSPAFGGTSWLGHATLQSGLWVDNQRSYDRLMASDHMSLSRAFGDAGWRTVAVLPSTPRVWPQGTSYYGYDKIYGTSSFGYTGPRFGWSKMPDQYALRRFQHAELAGHHRRPVMAEVDLSSSHAPWAPLPTMVPWSRLGDGSVFDRIHRRAETTPALWSHREDVPGAYMTSIEYSMTALTSFIEKYGDDDLVVVLLGDHQPATVVSGYGASHDVPITVIAQDRKVVRRVTQWGWQDGMKPDPNAPVWRMSDFRDRFLQTFNRP